MTVKALKVLSGTILLVFTIGFLVSNVPAYAINGHGTHFSPQFGAGPFESYTDGLTINFNHFDISNHTQTIKTQTIYVNDPTDIKLKIFHQATPHYIQHVIVYLNLSGSDPQSYQSDTWVEWDKQDGLSLHDPNMIFRSVTGSATFDSQFMYLTLHVVAQKPMNTSHMIITSWDTQLSTTTANVLNAINIKYLPFQFGR